MSLITRVNFSFEKLITMKKFLLLLVVIPFVSCQKTNEDPIIPIDGERVPSIPTEKDHSDMEVWKWLSLTDETQVSIEEAKQQALNVANQMLEAEELKPVLFASTSHKISTPISIEDVWLLNLDNNTQSGVSMFRKREEDHTDFYIIHYSDNRGYALVSGDKRVPGVLVYNSSGRLDSISNPGQAIMFHAIENYVKQQKELYEEEKDSLKKLTIARIIRKNASILPHETGTGFRKHPSYKDLTDCFGRGQKGVIKEIVKDEKFSTLTKKPLIKTLWDQLGEYNRFINVPCDNRYGYNPYLKAPVGCVAVAIAQIMSYHKKPHIFKGREMHWEDMVRIDPTDMFSSIDNFSVSRNTTAVTDIQYLLAKLGDPDMLNMNYSCEDGSGSNISKAIKTLQSLGYQADGNIDFNKDIVISNILNNKPIYISGCAFRHNIRYGFLNLNKRTIYNECHAWILDGYNKIERSYTRYLKSDCISEPMRWGTIVTEKTEYVHCNFGWGGRNNKGNDSRDATGWYKIGLFNTNLGEEGSRKAPSYQYNNYENSPDKKGNYQYNLKIINNIH